LSLKKCLQISRKALSQKFIFSINQDAKGLSILVQGQQQQFVFLLIVFISKQKTRTLQSGFIKKISLTTLLS